MSTAQSATSAPIVKIAAGAVIILSAVGVGAMTGLIPGVSSHQGIVQTTVEAPAMAPAEVQTKQVHRKQVTKEPVRVAAAGPARQEKIAAPVCTDCGVVESINAVEEKGDASGTGAVVGGVAGLVVGNQIGKGRGKTLAKIAGAAGGAYAGHQVEKNMRKTIHYEVSVRMNDGTHRTVSQPSDGGLAVGARVRVVGDAVMLDAS